MLPATDWPKSELWSSRSCFKGRKCQSWTLEREGPWWAEGLQAEGHSYSFTPSTACPDSWFASMPQMKKWTKESAQSLEGWSSLQICSIFVLSFPPTETANKPTEPITTYLCDMDTSSLCRGQSPRAHLGYIMNSCHITFCVLLKWESCRVN